MYLIEATGSQVQSRSRRRLFHCQPKIRNIVSLQSIFPISFFRISSEQRTTLLTFVSAVVLGAAVSAACFVLCGCASTNADVKTHTEPGFTGASIRRLAVFPIRNRRLTTSEARQLDAELSQAILKKRPSVVILPSAEAVKLLNESGLSDQAFRFHDNYYPGALPNASVLRRVGQALKVDAVLQGEIVNVQETDGVYNKHEGTTRVTLRYSMTAGESGKLLWEATSDGSVTTLTTVEVAPPMSYAVFMAQKKILPMLPF
jgi:hypothetical protein